MRLGSPAIDGAILELVEPRFHGAFRKFIDSGELDPDFEAYLDSDERCQRAVDLAAEAQLKALGAAGRDIRRALEQTAIARTATPQRTVAGRNETASAMETSARAVAGIAKGLELVVNAAAQVGAQGKTQEVRDVARQLDSALKSQHVAVPEQEARLNEFVEFASQVARAANQPVELTRAVAGSSS
jgi:hypothetical protein